MADMVDDDELRTLLDDAVADDALGTLFNEATAEFDRFWEATRPEREREDAEFAALLAEATRDGPDLAAMLADEPDIAELVAGVVQSAGLDLDTFLADLQRDETP